MNIPKLVTNVSFILLWLFKEGITLSSGKVAIQKIKCIGYTEFVIYMLDKVIHSLKRTWARCSNAKLV